jgi:hypothetical protein
VATGLAAQPLSGMTTRAGAKLFAFRWCLAAKRVDLYFPPPVLGEYYL